MRNLCIRTRVLIPGHGYTNDGEAHWAHLRRPVVLPLWGSTACETLVLGVILGGLQCPIFCRGGRSFGFTRKPRGLARVLRFKILIDRANSSVFCDYFGTKYSGTLSRSTH
ncbi:hypothetical protein AVEN_258824-1 [Araneus ventricosus]|uniref:Uncharacterized protein n=1 Tax=Araneus ventricosus TaxID=182803 RepID=A0A4Y2WAD3_ARAVE|nr:hypothetical protein AVEN_258824-1 [Araneus ventricosus]